MRRAAVIGLGVLSISACDGADPRDSEPVVVPTTVKFLLPTVASEGLELCYALRVEDASGEVWLERGITAEPEATASAARDAGALCATGAPAVLTVACEPGEKHSAQLWLHGVYDASGTLDDDVATELGGDGQVVSFECLAGQETVVDGFELTLMRDANQGFIQVDIVASVPTGIADVCYAIRVESGAATDAVTWAQGGLCTSQYGAPPTGLTYIGPCSSDEGAESSTVTTWVESVTWKDEVPTAERVFANPCPQSGEGDMAGWTGGCELRATCVENMDVEVLFDLWMHPAGGGFF